MPYAVVLFFNKSQSLPFEATIEELAVKNVAPFMFEESIPHITLAIYDEINHPKSKEKIEEFASKFNNMSLVFSHVGFIKSKMKTVFAAPVVTNSLLEYHRQFHDHFKNDGVNSWEHYLPENWIPHCTLAFDVAEEKVGQALSICTKLDFPIEITTSSIGIMEFEPVREIYRIPFNNSRSE